MALISQISRPLLSTRAQQQVAAMAPRARAPVEEAAMALGVLKDATVAQRITTAFTRPRLGV